MRKFAPVCMAAAVLLGGVNGAAQAHGGFGGGGFSGHGGFHHFHHHFHDHVFFGAFFGDPFLWGPYPYYDYGYGYGYQPFYMEQSPPVYIQQQPGYWYYCPTTRAYYPYVASCDVPWQHVAPVPPTPYGG